MKKRRGGGEMRNAEGCVRKKLVDEFRAKETEDGRLTVSRSRIATIIARRRTARALFTRERYSSTRLIIAGIE